MTEWFFGIFSKPISQFTLIDIGGVLLILAAIGLVFAILTSDK